jgi:hypothetical protein
MSDAQVRFAARRYDGAQQVLRSEAVRLRAASRSPQWFFHYRGLEVGADVHLRLVPEIWTIPAGDDGGRSTSFARSGPTETTASSWTASACPTTSAAPSGGRGLLTSTPPSSPRGRTGSTAGSSGFRVSGSGGATAWCRTSARGSRLAITRPPTSHGRGLRACRKRRSLRACRLEASGRPDPLAPEYGVPIGSPTQGTGARVHDLYDAGAGVYCRRFSRGLVLVNPTSPVDDTARARRVHLGRTMYLAVPHGGGEVPSSGVAPGNVSYRTVRSVRLPAYSGAVLLDHRP